jgi:hypothetical protein
MMRNFRRPRFGVAGFFGVFFTGFASFAARDA